MLNRLLSALENKGISGRGSASKIAKATGYSAATVSVAFSDDQKLTDKFLRAVCTAYGINEEWVKTGKGEMFKSLADRLSVTAEEVIERMRQMGIAVGPKLEANHTKPTSDVQAEITNIMLSHRTIPVISYAQAGDSGFWEDAYPVGEGMERIDCPAQITDPNAFAFRVEGTSMVPRYYQGETVIVDTSKEVINNDDVVVKLKDGRVMVKRYRKTNGTVLLESYNPTEDLIIAKPEEIRCCYKVVCRI